MKITEIVIVKRMLMSCAVNLRLLLLVMELVTTMLTVGSTSRSRILVLCWNRSKLTLVIHILSGWGIVRRLIKNWILELIGI